MATIDITRSIFEPRKRYAGVRMQQGRVVLDADHNEAGELDAEDARRTRLDVIGPSGSPDDGFRIESATLTGALVDFAIRAGTIYVGGIPVRLDHDSAFSAQPDWVGITDGARTRDALLPADLVYLEVWQQPVSAEEDRELAEPALGGPDTTTRLRTMARVRRFSVAETSCTEAWDALTAELATAAAGTWNPDTCELEADLRLALDYLGEGTQEDLCSPSAIAGFLGAENQAIRVQILAPVGAVGDGELTWGYDNAAPLYRARVIDGTTLELESLPRDEAHWPLLEQTLEVLPWSAVLVPDANPAALTGEVLADNGGRAADGSGLLSLGSGHLTTLSGSYSSTTHRLTLVDALPATFNARGAAHVAAGVDGDHAGSDRSALVFVRLWNRGSDLSSAARIPYSLGSALTLGNTGLRVTISGSHLGADAHWILAARPNTPDQVYPWSFDAGTGRAPNGVRRFLVPLAVITWTGTTGTVHDCRETFRPLTRIRSCCRYSVGDGEESHGDFSSIQEALDNLPASGGEICVLPGTYEGLITIEGRSNVTIHGCGARSLVVSASPPDAVIVIRDSEGIVLRDFALSTDTGWGIQLSGDAAGVSDVELAGLEITVRDRGALFAEAVTNLSVHDSRLIARALIADPAQDSEIGRVPLVQIQGVGLTLTQNLITAEPGTSPVRRAAGGVQIGGESEDVVIDHNRIVGGNGNGITLGHVTLESEPGFGFFFMIPFWYWDGNCLRLIWIVVGGGSGPGEAQLINGGDLERVRIRHNQISEMAGDGIGVPWFFEDEDGDDAPDDLITVRELRVVANRINGCNTGERDKVSDFLVSWSGHGPIALADVEDGVFRDNEIRDNGVGIGDPICGIFILNSEGVVVERNRVTNNGRAGATYTGYLGGLVLALVSPRYENESDWDGRPAARIEGNQVVAPEGPALWLRASSGTVNVVGNELTTNAGLRPVIWGLAADIINAGSPSERFEQTKGWGSLTADRGGQIVYSRNVVTYQAASTAASFALWITVLLTLDDVQASDNVCRADVGDASLLTDLFAFGSTLDIANNRFRETPNSMPLSIFSFGILNQTVGNVCTHCVLVFDYSVTLKPPPPPPAPPPSPWSDGVVNRSLYDAFHPNQGCPDFDFTRPGARFEQAAETYEGEVKYAPILKGARA